jgi:mannose-6-phosphate isomerase-like protein (cupin superfamily)
MNTVFCTDISSVTEQNNFFRRVISTTTTQQLVVMSLIPGEEIGSEVHPYTTQFFRVEKGKGLLLIDDQPHCYLEDGSAIVIPPNTRHNIINTSNTDLKLYTIYSPPNHPENRIDVTKPDEL